jgi:acetoacetyl-CoA synthetase
MMWNYLVSALAGGTQIVLYDGSPLYPKPSSQLAIVKREHVEDWGTSPKFLESLKATSFAVPPLPQLAVVDVTGSALSAELYDWFYTKFPSRLGLLSGSGGTDLVGGSRWPPSCLRTVLWTC